MAGDRSPSSFSAGLLSRRSSGDASRGGGSCNDWASKAMRMKSVSGDGAGRWRRLPTVVQGNSTAQQRAWLPASHAGRARHLPRGRRSHDRGGCCSCCGRATIALLARVAPERSLCRLYRAPRVHDVPLPISGPPRLSAVIPDVVRRKTHHTARKVSGGCAAPLVVERHVEAVEQWSSW